MSTIKKYDIPGIDNIPSRYDPLVPLLVEKSDLFFRWQILVGDQILESSRLDNYMGIPANAINFNNPQGPTIAFNLKTLLGPKNLHPGSYSLRLYANRLWKNQGNTKQVKFYVKTISTKKDELVLGVHDPILTVENRAQTTAYQSAVDQVLNPVTGILSVDRPVLSLEDGSVVNVISHKIIGGNKYTTLDFAVKTSEPIPKNLKPGSLLKVEIAIIEPREFNFIIPQAPYVEDLNIMALPDFTTNFATAQGPLSSKYETWESLFGSNEGVKNKLLNATFSGSKATSAELGMDFRKYENFVHFSSAKERLDNFKYKIQLIEYYDSKITALSASLSPSAETNRGQFVTKKNDIISKFDAYENYLYTESSSYESGSYGIFNASTWPKSNSTIPYTLTSSTSSAFTEWYATQSLTAVDYDIDNPYNLEKTIPAHVRLDRENANYLMFVNMIGQNFDHVYNYIDHMGMIHDRQNELHLGLSKDLVWDVLKSLGWHGINGYNFEDLWAYKLGTNESGSYQATDSGSTQTFINASSMPTEDITKEIWSRTLNNLPHLLSTKGTERAVRALVNTYGLPPTVLRIKEYGGTPKEMSTSQYIKYENSGYSLNFDGNQFIQTPWAKLESNNYSHISTDKAPDLIELRFNATKPQSSILIHSSFSQWGVELEAHPSASNTSSAYHNYGRLWMGARSASALWTASATQYHPLFDNDWWNIQFGITSNDTFNLHLKKSADHSNGLITHEEKVVWDMGAGGYDVYGSNWSENETLATLTLGNHDPYNSGAAGWKMASGSTVDAGTLPGFTGSIQELRYWAFADDTILNDAAFNNHVLSPLSIEGNTYTASYTDLVARWPMGSTGVTASLNSVTLPSKHPNQNISTTPFVSAVDATMSLSGSGYTGTSADWQYEEETFYTVVPEIIGTRAVSDKIRIIDETYSGSLYMDSSVVSSSTELSAPDSPLLGVFFSPNDDIDLDISHTIGGAKFDDFVGNPRDAYRTLYKELGHIRNHYWQKYLAAPSFTAYLKVLKYFDSSLFLQLESLLPARANKQTGLLIKPNLLERPTIARVSESFANLTYEQVEGVDTTLYSFSTWTPEPLITATAKTYIINGRDTHASATPHFPNSFDDSLATGYGISNMASADVPVYDRSTVSRRYRTQATDGTDTSISVQDFVPTAIANQRYAGSKYGKVGGSIGGIINLINDPSVTGKGLFDSSTNIKCAIEVVETNPIELTTTQGPLTALGDIQIR
tara:strand:+ start:4317 stop:8024 length:3708 start_codon:yes stop_codon:yes gene_type:complete